MEVRDTTRPAPSHGEEATRPWVVPVAVVGAAGVVAYVAAWAAAGILWSGYDPVTQAISELFAQGAHPTSARLLEVVLVVTGLLLPAFAAALHHGLPGRSATGPALAALSGVCTVAIVAYPCSPGCPGADTSATDLGHTVLAGVGYAALVVVPLLFARRVRHAMPRFARWSVVLGGLATAGFVLRIAGVGDEVGGLLQRSFNTIADAWYVLAAVVIVRRARART